MSQNPNQFSQSVVKGLADLRFNPNVIPCRVASNEAAPLVNGQQVKLVDIIGGSPVVTAITSNSDKVFGVVGYNIKDKNYQASQPVEILSFNSVVYMEASAAIARGADVMPVIAGQKVATASGGGTVLGIALDKALADGDLIRVLLLPVVAGNGISVQPDIADLSLTASVAYDASELQDVADKVDDILAALRLAGILA
jgi:hypothetical protein